MKRVYQSTLLCCLVLWALSDDRKCSDSGASFDDCDTNCSQWEKRVPGEPEYLFNCSIGRKADVERFKVMFPNAFNEDALKSFDPPKLLTVNGFYKDYKDQELRSLAIDFQLPKGIRTATGEFELPKAVLLQFRSIADPEVQDNFYYQCERQRLFSFIDYKVMSTYDVVMPRNLSFNCFIGLSNNRMEKKPRRVYLITLTTAFGRSATYTVTTYALSELMTTVWYPAIATHLNETQGTIYVVFEEAPSTTAVHSYEIQLLKNVSGSMNLIKTLKVTEPKPVVFENLWKGKYFIKVIPTGTCNRSGTCRQSLSYVIDGHALPPQDYRIHYLDAMPDRLKLVAMVLGCILAIMLLLLVVFCWWRRKRKGSEELGTEKWGWIVHPYETCSKEEDCVLKLSRFLEKECHCKLHPLTLPETTPSAQQYCRDVLKDSSFLLVVLDNSGSELSMDCTAENFYGFTISEGISVRQIGNSLHIFPIMFSFCNPQTEKPPLLTDFKSFQLLSELDKVYCKIHGISETDISNQRMLLRTKPGYLSLENAIQDCSRNNLMIPSTDPLPPGELNKPSTPKNKKEALDIIWKINSSNEDDTDEKPKIGGGYGARPKEISNISAQQLQDKHRPVSRPTYTPSNGKTSEYGFSGSQNRYSGHPNQPQFPPHHFHNNCYTKQMSYPMDNHNCWHMQHGSMPDHDMKECVEHAGEYWNPGNNAAHHEEKLNYYHFTSVPDNFECHAHPGQYQQMYEDQFYCPNNSMSPQISGTESVAFNFPKNRLGNEMMPKQTFLPNDQDVSIEKVMFNLNHSDEDDFRTQLVDRRNDLWREGRLLERDTYHHGNDCPESQRSRLLQDSEHPFSKDVPSTGSLPDDILMHSWDGNRQSFVAPDDEEAETLLSSQEQLAQLESFNLKYS